MSSLIIVTNMVTLKRIVIRVFLETMFVLSIIQIESFSLLDYAEGMTKAGTGLMNTDQKDIFKVTLCYQKTP